MGFVNFTSFIRYFKVPLNSGKDRSVSEQFGIEKIWKRTRVEMNLEETPDEANIVIQHLNKVILEGKPMYVTYHRVPNRKLDEDSTMD